MLGEHMKKTSKPIHKCHGCPLNFKKYCGRYETPRDMWGRGKCPGFMNEEMLEEYNRDLEATAVKTPREKRKEAARQAKTEEHHQGGRDRRQR